MVKYSIELKQRVIQDYLSVTMTLGYPNCLWSRFKKAYAA